jgi:hypothetical protein
MVETAPCPLIGERGVGEAVAQHRVAACERRLNDTEQMVATCREHEQRLGQCIHRLVQHQIAQHLRQRRAAGLARHHDTQAAVAQPRRQRLDVRRLAGAVDAFEGDEAAHGHGSSEVLTHGPERPPR